LISGRAGGSRLCLVVGGHGKAGLIRSSRHRVSRDATEARSTDSSGGGRLALAALVDPALSSRFHSKRTAVAPRPTYIDHEEDDMTGTLTTACPLCGLRYASRPLLELHIREDHRLRRRRAAPGGPSGSHGLAAKPSRTATEVTAMTATRRVIRAVRHVNDELLRASEAIIGSARAPQPGRGHLRPRT
jgi:hypothetical protein